MAEILTVGRNTDSTEQDHCRVSDFNMASLVGILFIFVNQQIIFAEPSYTSFLLQNDPTI